MKLIDSLGCAIVAELVRAIGREHHQRHSRQVGFNNGREEVGGGSSRGGQHTDRFAERPCQPKTEVSRRPFVKMHPQLDAWLLGQLESQRRRTRAWASADVAKASARKLLYEGADNAIEDLAWVMINKLDFLFSY